ncbi:MAG TPA: hypothetical protein VKO67_00590, partial [Smithellaceae bacterium]|nr:hypothetical protein [Smithellaceae bacterium]
LELRLAKLAADGIAKEKAQSDSVVKNLKSKIRETNVRIAAFEKNIKKAQELAKAKEEKLAAKAAPKAAPAAEEKEAKPKKKVADKEGKKTAAEGDAAKKPKKKKEETAA